MKLPKEPKMEIVITKRKIGQRVATFDDTPSMTQQQFKEQCDVNNIIAKYKATGELHHIARTQGVYADLSNVPDYQTALDTVLRAETAFGNLPAAVRERFKNNPEGLLEFVQDPKNKEEGIRLGLFNPDSPDQTQTQPVISDAPKTKTKTNEPNEQK